jgi:hypothetical protein
MACLELMLKCVSVNGIIRLMGSVCLGPKVIPLSGTHCTKICPDLWDSWKYLESLENLKNLWYNLFRTFLKFRISTSNSYESFDPQYWFLITIWDKSTDSQNKSTFFESLIQISQTYFFIISMKESVSH